MKQNDIDFCKQHIINFEAVKHGFTRNIPFDVLGRYEQMYREYLDPQFHLTYWCGECVFDMLKRLIHYYEPFAQSNMQNIALSNVNEKITIKMTSNGATEYPIEKKKRGRPKK
jgi:hypothetical protein